MEAHGPGENKGKLMRIIHVGGLATPHTVDGINTVIWAVAAEQARLGHDVSLLVSDPPDESACQHARRLGVELLYVPATRWRYDSSISPELIIEPAVDIVHLHSVFIPRQATLARDLRRWGIPYVVTPHGGLMPQVLERNQIKKRIYSLLVEQPRIRHAAAVAYITPGGGEDIRRFVPDFDGPVRWVPNPVNVERLGAIGWRPEGSRPQLAFLGRYDVYHKGIDRLAEIAKRLPEVDVRAYGIEDPKTLRHLDVIRRFGPPNLTINDPIFGEEKSKVLAHSTMYVQVSRWEALSISILEALAIGIPCVIAESMSMASMFRSNDLGLVVSTRPELAAAQIREALAVPERLDAWSAHARAFARQHFSPKAVTEKIMGIYEDALAHYHSGGAGSIMAGFKRNRQAGQASFDFGEQCQDEEGSAENLEDFFNRRHRRVEKVVDLLIVGNDA